MGLLFSLIPSTVKTCIPMATVIESSCPSNVSLLYTLFFFSICNVKSPSGTVLTNQQCGYSSSAILFTISVDSAGMLSNKYRYPQVSLANVRGL